MSSNLPDSRQPFLVQSIYPFKGKHNDELCFKKGDIITVTQVDNGGWWEGTLDDKTGWFPYNYVKQYKPSGNTLSGDNSTDSKLPAELITQQQVNRTFIVKDLVSSEKAHVTELQMLVNKFLHPTPFLKLMGHEEYNQLISNIAQVLNVHEKLLLNLKEAISLPLHKQKIGGVFLNIAPKIKQVYKSYCASHPLAVLIIEKYKEELGTLMERNGAASPGILVLTAGLSKPFRRLDKYTGILKELERYVEEYNADRGDIQRSISVYTDIIRECSFTRYQKEMELELLNGGISSWKGCLSTLGDIMHMGSVAIYPDYKDRYFLLFSSVLLILSIPSGMNSFQYEGILPLIGVTVSKLEDSSDAYKNAFGISGRLLIKKMVVICQTKDDQQVWLHKLHQQISATSTTVHPAPAVAAAPPATVSPNSVNVSSKRRSPIINPTAIAAPARISPSKFNNAECNPKIWSVLNLHLLPPINSITSYHVYNTGNSYDHMDDIKILQVIENYCTNVKSHCIVSTTESN